MDIQNLQYPLRSDIRRLSSDVDALQRELRLQRELLLASMTIRFGVMLAVGLGLFFVAMKLTER